MLSGIKKKKTIQDNIIGLTFDLFYRLVRLKLQLLWKKSKGYKTVVKLIYTRFSRVTLMIMVRVEKWKEKMIGAKGLIENIYLHHSRCSIFINIFKPKFTRIPKLSPTLKCNYIKNL